MPHIISTLTNSQQITEWKKPQETPGKLSSPAVKGRSSVLIKGTIGASAGGLQAQGGVVTHVTDDELEFLQRQPSFQQFVARGHFRIVAKEPTPKSIDKIVDEMPRDDGSVGGENGEEIAGSAQLSQEEGDFEAGGRAAGPAPDELKIV